MKRLHTVVALSWVVLLTASCARPARGVSTVLYDSWRGGGAGTVALRLIRADGRGERALPEREVGDMYGNLSPDGTRVLYSLRGQWWILPLDGSEPVPVPKDGLRLPWPIGWLHDGKRIVLRAMEAASGTTALYVIDPGAKTIRQLPLDGIQFACSATDNRVAVLTFEGDEAHISIVDVDTGRVERVPAVLGPVYADELAWSPDGSRFALLRAVMETEGGVLIVDARRGDAWPVGLDVANTKRGIGCLRWSPQGDRLLFVSDRERPETVSILDVATGKETPLVEDIASVCPCWSPDGREIAFTYTMGKTGGAAQVCTVDVATGRLVQLTDDDDYKAVPMWGMVPAAVWDGSVGEGGG